MIYMTQLLVRIMVHLRVGR